MSEERDVTHSNPVEQLGFTQIPNAVLLNGDLSPEARILYGVLKSYAWFDRDDAWPGKQRIAQQVGINPKNVLRYQNELIDAKLITVERRGLGRTNRYIIHPPSKAMARRVRELEEEARQGREGDMKRNRVKRGVDPEAPVRALAPDLVRAPSTGHVRLPAPDKAYEGKADEVSTRQSEANNGNGAGASLSRTDPGQENQPSSGPTVDNATAKKPRARDTQHEAGGPAPPELVERVCTILRQIPKPAYGEELVTPERVREVLGAIPMCDHVVAARELAHFELEGKGSSRQEQTRDGIGQYVGFLRKAQSTSYAYGSASDTPPCARCEKGTADGPGWAPSGFATDATRSARRLIAGERPAPSTAEMDVFAPGMPIARWRKLPRRVHPKPRRRWLSKRRSRALRTPEAADLTEAAAA